MQTKQQTDERGIAHIGIVLLILVVVAVIGFAGWKVMSGGKKDKTTTTNASTGSPAVVESTCQTKLHDAELCKFEAEVAARPLDKIAFAAVLTTATDSGTSTIHFQQDGKGNTSLSTVGGDVSLRLNSVTYNGDVYIKSDGDMWTKYPAGRAPIETTPANDLSFLSSVVKTQFTKVGSEACDTLTCLKYKFTDSSDPGATQFVWFDTKDHKIRQFRSTGGDSGTVDMKVTYPAVNITAPSPTQDFSIIEQ